MGSIQRDSRPRRDRCRPSGGPAGARRQALRRPLPLLLALLLPLAALSACQGASEDQPVELVEGFAGLVAADEPRATLVGRDVLGNGGNAVDAAVAVYFTLAVTLPSRASLGGGGSCVVFDNEDKTGEALVFPPRLTSAGGVAPMGSRAMAALHARQGRIKWGELVSPAENLARFGHAASRAFAYDLSVAADLIARGPELSQTFRTRDGRLPGEGDQIVQPELSAVLSGIRSQGAAYMHAGPFAERFAEASTEAGVAVTVQEMRESVPYYGPAIGFDMALIGNDVAFFPPPPAANGTVAAELWRILDDVEEYGGAPADRAHLFLEASMRAYSDRGAWMNAQGGSSQEPAAIVADARLESLMSGYDRARHTPAASLSAQPPAIAEPGAGASFAVADRFGNSVACSLDMNGLFGSGRMAPGSGIVLAEPPSASSNGFLSPAAVVVGNTTNGETRFAAAAAGGAPAAAALVKVMLETLEEDQPLEQAMRAPRLFHGGRPDEAFYEKGLGAEVIRALQQRGHRVQEAASIGLVNALHCPDGQRDDWQTCRVASDPRARGLAQVVQ